MNAFIERHADRIAQVSESGCMIWLGASTPGGYGIVWDGKKSPAGNNVPDGAHRVSFQTSNGAMPESAHVLHRCDVRCCVNPDHLFLGNQDANMKDMAAKGRSCLGSRHGKAKMNESDVVRLRSEYRFHRITAADLAKKSGFGKGAVAAAIRGTTWKHIEGTAP